MRNVMVPLLFAFFLVGCQSKSAFDYSQRIVQMETEFSSAISVADEKVGDFLDKNQQDSAISISRHMEELADSKLKEIQQLEAPNVEEGENFKKAAVQYFVYLKAVYSSFNKFTMATSEEEKEDESTFYSEWKSNRFCRQFTLPSNVDPESVNAELKDGILRMTLKKIAPKEPSKIEVKPA